MNFLILIIHLAVAIHIALYPTLAIAYRRTSSHSTRRRILGAITISMIADLLFIGVALDKYYCQ